MGPHFQQTESHAVQRWVSFAMQLSGIAFFASSQDQASFQACIHTQSLLKAGLHQQFAYMIREKLRYAKAILRSTGMDADYICKDSSSLLAVPARNAAVTAGLHTSP